MSLLILIVTWCINCLPGGENLLFFMHLEIQDKQMSNLIVENSLVVKL